MTEQCTGALSKSTSANLMIYGGPAATSLLPIGNAQINSQEVFVTPFSKNLHAGGEAGPIESPFLVPLIVSNGTGASGFSWEEIDFDTKTYPALLHPLEQHIILRYLRSKCHSLSRLQTQGYILEPGTVCQQKLPFKGFIPTYHFRRTPSIRKSEVMKRQAIVIDCEMVGVKNNHQTVALLTAIDFLNGDDLISRYVALCENVLGWRSKITGVTEDTMKSAVLSRAVFKNQREAREKL
ncbi:ribonuclease H-like protein [Penicillium angulare]|uniref:Ribonuclease H-like protein n=1 Tax=Penicillium angulare TaxID=116970 RepID=A0A9W9K6R8_9EURO|nr:ribonuclease H-like protein [Penicillium angulare]